MSTAAAKAAGGGELAVLLTHPITYPVTVDEVARIRSEYAELAQLDAHEPGHYEEIRVAIGKLRSTRTAIEKRRKELKAGALEYGRSVDEAAKKLTAAIAEIEDPLSAKKDAVDAERERQRIEAEKAEVLRLEAELKAKREADEAAARAAREAEEKRLAEERAKHEAERAEFARRQAEAEAKRRADEERLAAERAALDADRRKLDEEKAAAARAEQERIAKEAAARAAAEEAARLEALRPDIEKVRAWAPAILALAESAPEVSAPEAKSAIAWGVARLLKTAEALENFTPATQGEAL